MTPVPTPNNLIPPQSMKTNRRSFLSSSLGGLTALSLPSATSQAANPSPAQQSAIKLGLVSYNLAKDWDVPTIIRNCSQTGFQGVELRTTHAHGVEVSLSAPQRKEIQHQFKDSPVELMGLGSAFDYHTTNPAKLKADVAATKDYVVLAHDVGASGIKVRPNGLPEDKPVIATLEQIGRSLREISQFAADYGQQIRLEVHGAGTSFPPHIRTILDVADHPNVGACWNSNDTDLDGQGFEHNFNLLKHKIFSVHMRDLSLTNYPFRKLLNHLNDLHYTGYCLAEIGSSSDPIRVMQYYRALFLAYQNLI
jgi:sugar phosphate isomerase/epimerase